MVMSFETAILLHPSVQGFETVRDKLFVTIEATNCVNPAHDTFALSFERSWLDINDRS